MHLPSRRRLLLGLAGSVVLPEAVRAQGRYPTRPITLVVPFAPGGVADLTARSVAEQMARSLGQPIVVDNRPSAGSIVASTAVAKAPPDGYTLLMMSNSNALSVGLFRTLPYDTLKDFAPIATLGFFDIGLFVAANSRFASLRELVVFAKANPGKLNFGTISVGSTQHLAAKLFETVAGIDALVVPYKGSPAVLTALRAGEIDLAFEIVAPMAPQLEAGVVKALAVSSSQASPALTGVPTVLGSGIAGYDVASWNALAAPAGTPAEVVERLNRAAREAVATPAVQAKLGALGVRLSAGTPAEMRTLLDGEIRRWGQVIRSAKIEPE